jgi:hypothetical protein
MSPKRCPHCLKRVPFRKRFRKNCPHCFKAFRRRSGMPERSLIGQWLEDRNTTFWVYILVIFFGLLAMIMQVSGNPDLLWFIDNHLIWFALSIGYLAMFARTIGQIFFPLMLNAPRIMRRERPAIKQYRTLTTVGLILGIPFAFVFIRLMSVGVKSLWMVFPGTVLLFTLPTVLMWAYHALTLTEEDYEDERVVSFLQEVGAADRLEHRHNAYFVLFGVPLSIAVFYFFLVHPYIANMLKESSDSGLIAMFLELYHRTTSHMPAKG